MRHALRNSGSGLAGWMLGATAVVVALTLNAHADWSVVNLHPAGMTDSGADGVYGGQQVGTAWVAGIPRASLWSGTADSWVDLTPAGANWSQALGVYAGHQVGSAWVVGDFWRASLWSGSAAS